MSFIVLIGQNVTPTRLSSLRLLKLDNLIRVPVCNIDKSGPEVGDEQRRKGDETFRVVSLILFCSPQVEHAFESMQASDRLSF